jgi:cyclic pyranopterin phosphate synthase
MPEADYVWLPRTDLLTFEEMVRLVRVFARVGVDRVRLTGGEPLLRRNLPQLVASLAAEPALRDLAITTNGVLLEAQAAELRNAGLHRVTVSLDTLDRSRFQALTRLDQHEAVLAGITEAFRVFGTLKIDTVVIRGFNDDEVCALIEFGRRFAAEVRFIEYMDVGGATRWSREQVVSRAEMLGTIAARYGEPAPVHEISAAPADRYRLPDGAVFGIISSTTQPFCAACDRARLTADGHWLLCLYARDGTDLRGPLRGGASDEELEALIRRVWTARTDRGAEARLALLDRTAHSARTEDVHLQMHTRGG